MPKALLAVISDIVVLKTKPAVVSAVVLTQILAVGVLAAISVKLLAQNDGHRARLWWWLIVDVSIWIKLMKQLTPG